MDVDDRWLMEAQARQGRDGNVKAQARWMQVQQMQERLRQTTRRTACPAQSSPALLGFGMPRAKAVSRSYRGGGLLARGSRDGRNTLATKQGRGRAQSDVCRAQGDGEGEEDGRSRSSCVGAMLRYSTEGVCESGGGGGGGGGSGSEAARGGGEDLLRFAAALELDR